MADYVKKIEKDLEKIASTLSKLDDTLDKLDDSPGKVKHYFEQEKAIHEVKKITHECIKLINHTEDAVKDGIHTVDTAVKNTVDDLNANEQAKSDLVTKIDKTLDQLDKDLSTLNDDETNKAKSYLAQKKAIHHVKKLLHQEGLYDQYNENELADLGL